MQVCKNTAVWCVVNIITALWCTVITLVWCVVIKQCCSVRCCNYCSTAVTVLYPWPGVDIWDKSVTYSHGVMLLLNHHIHGKIFYRILPKIKHKCQQPSSFMTPISGKLYVLLQRVWDDKLFIFKSGMQKEAENWQEIELRSE